MVENDDTETPREMTDEEAAAMFERAARRSDLRRTLALREELNDYMRKNPSLTLQEALAALFRNAEREIEALEQVEHADG